MNTLAELAAQLMDDARELPAVIICHPDRWAALARAATSYTLTDPYTAPARLLGVLLEADGECPRDQMILVPASQLQTYERGRRWADPVRCAEVAAACAKP